MGKDMKAVRCPRCNSMGDLFDCPDTVCPMGDRRIPQLPKIVWDTPVSGRVVEPELDAYDAAKELYQCQAGANVSRRW